MSKLELYSHSTKKGINNKFRPEINHISGTVEFRI